ncbi:Uncharacterised protein [Klebsiella pneumoniae]|nr:Uncharacterised protein [Klebsiella pneumoniae]SLW81623.1 Uncharacterised protein [Klebsiella pneumoniae]SLW94935.1 Uncharacterised protein [Klebsiella pneumoniae]SLX21477.1 Uncharacterised protein [Klebsiella pneumoniae]SLY59310.1 Uncharacterised protein [Klebsiella pneumoniae]
MSKIIVIRRCLVVSFIPGRGRLLLLGPAQGISSLSLLTYFTAWADRSGAEYTVRNNLITLLHTTILTSPLIELHIARHADKVAFMVFGQRVSLLTKGNHAQPESSLSVICRITGQSYRRRAIVMFVPFPVVLVCGSATSRPYAEI